MMGVSISLLIGVLSLLLGGAYHLFELSLGLAYAHYVLGAILIFSAMLFRRSGGDSVQREVGFFQRSIPLLSGIVIASALYGIISLIPFSYDLSIGKKFSLNTSTLNTLEKLSLQATFLQINAGDTKTIRSERELIDRFVTERSDNLTFKSINPIKDFESVNRFNLKRSDRVVVLDNNGGEKDYVTLREVNEQSLTTALMRLQQSEKPLISYIVGHGELGLMSKDLNGLSKMRELFEKEGAVIRELDLSTFEGESLKSSVVLILGPKKQFSQNESAILRKYLEDGGTVIYGAEAESETVLSEILTPLGIKVSPKPLVRLQQGESGERQLSLELPVRLYRDHPITSQARGEASFLFSKAAALEMNSFDRSLVSSVQELFSYSVGKEKISLGAVSTWASGGRLFVIGDSTWISNAFIERGFNRELAEGLLLWATNITPPITMESAGSVKPHLISHSLKNGLIMIFILLAEMVIIGGIFLLFFRRNRAIKTRLHYGAS